MALFSYCSAARQPFEWFLVPRNGFVLILCILPFIVFKIHRSLLDGGIHIGKNCTPIFDCQLSSPSNLLLVSFMKKVEDFSAERYLIPSLLLVCLATGVWIAFHFSKYTLYATRTIVIPSIVFLFFFACIQLQAQLSSQRDDVGVGKYRDRLPSKQID